MTTGARSPWLVLAVTALATTVAMAFGRFTYPVLLPAIEADLLGSYSLAGFLGTANLTGYLLGSLAVSIRGGRADPSRLVVGGLLISAAGFAILAVASSAAVLAIALLLTGFAGALIWISALSLTSVTFAFERRGLAMGWIGAGMGVGLIFVSQLAGLLRITSGADTWRPVWLVEAAIAVLGVAAAIRYLPRLPRAPGSPLALAALRRVPRWRALVGLYVSFAVALTLVFQFLVAMLEDDFGFSPAHASGVFTVIATTGIAGSIFAGRASDAIGRRPILVAAFATMAVATPVLLVGQEPFTFVAAAVLGTALAGVPGLVAAQLGDQVDAAGFPAAFGALTLCFGMAQLAAPQLGGALADRTGSFTLTFLLATAAAGLGTIAAWMLPRRAPA